MKFTTLFSLTVFFLTIYVIYTNLNLDLSKNLNNLKEKKPIVIAHRGASGYLPEHTLAAKSLAYGQGVDYLEQDLVLTKDGKLVVMHDIILDDITDVSQRKEFKNKLKKRFGFNEPHYYVIDFTLDEIKSLRVIENKAQYPNRFPKGKSNFRIHTFEEEIELIQGLNHSTGKNIGIYPEIKAPWFYESQGKDLTKKILLSLKKYGYVSQKDKVFLQSFDPNSLRRIKNELFPKLKMKLPLIQLVAHSNWNETYELKNGKYQNYSYDWMMQKSAMKEITKYADGIGLHYSMLFDEDSTPEDIKLNPLIKEARKNNLKIHVYTFRKDDLKLTKYVKSIEEFHKIILLSEIEGLFSDFPDVSKNFFN